MEITELKKKLVQVRRNFESLSHKFKEMVEKNEKIEDDVKNVEVMRIEFEEEKNVIREENKTLELRLR